MRGCARTAFVLFLGGLLRMAGASDHSIGAQKTILDLQQFRQTSSIHIKSQKGREGVATLVNLNPAINAWYLLRVAWNDGAPEVSFHLENAEPRAQRLLLDENFPAGLAVSEGRNRYYCDLFDSDFLDEAKASTAHLCSPVQRALVLAQCRDRASNQSGGHNRVSAGTCLGRRENHWARPHPAGRHAARDRETGDRIARGRTESRRIERASVFGPHRFEIFRSSADILEPGD